jgi:hypothetical protein
MRAIGVGAFGKGNRCGLFVLCLLLFGVPAMAQEPAPLQQPPLPVGTRITQQNWQQYKSYMPQGLIEIWSGKHPWKLPSDAVMEVGPNREYPNPQSWYDVTEKYGNQTKLMKLDTGGYTIQGYVTGVPFPRTELTGPDGSYKLLYNAYYHYFPALNHFASLGYETDRFLNQAPSYSYQMSTTLAHNSDPGFPRNSTEMPGYFLAFYDEIMSPEQTKYTAPLELLYDDPQKLPESYVFLPSLRRALRLSSGSRCAPFAGSDYVGDDVVNGVPSPPGLFQVTRQADRKLLVFLPTPEETPKQFDAKNFYWPPMWFPRPSAGKWLVRDVYVLDLQRLPQFRAGYCYGLRRMYLDKATYNLVAGDLYDAQIKYWKSIGFLEGPQPIPGGGYLHDVRGINWMIDFQGEHASWAIVGADVWEIDNQVPATYRDERRYASPSGLADVMK